MLRSVKRCAADPGSMVCSVSPWSRLWVYREVRCTASGTRDELRHTLARSLSSRFLAREKRLERPPPLPWSAFVRRTDGFPGRSGASCPRAASFRSFREIATASAGSAQISRATLRASASVWPGATTALTKPANLRVVGAEGASHHQHRKGALMSHGARHQQAGGAFRDQAEMDERRGKRRRRAGENVVAVEQHGGADTDRDGRRPRR